jgi:hypothetical protein
MYLEAHAQLSSVSFGNFVLIFEQKRSFYIPLVAWSFLCESTAVFNLKEQTNILREKLGNEAGEYLAAESLGDTA